MTPVEVLIAMAKAGTISPDEFYSKMLQHGITASEAQTMMSNASGGQSQGLDPTLDSARSQPLDASAYNYGPPQTATVMRDEYAPRESIMDKIRRGPAAQAIEIARAKLEGREPNLGAGNGPSAAAPGAGPAQYSPMSPPPSAPQISDPTGQTTPTSPYVPRQFQESGSPYLGSPFQTAEQSAAMNPNENRRYPTVQQAINIAKERTTSPQMAATETSRAAPQSDSIQSLIRGRFGEAAKGSATEDRLTTAQEARDRMGDGRASGGAVGGKDAALHKALEIIHHLIRIR